MANYRTTGPQIAVRGVRVSLPGGFVLGRSSQGNGPAELIPISGGGSLATQMQQNGSIPTRLTQLADVGITSVSDKQRFRFSTSAGKWVNVNDTLANLTDVNTTGLATGSLLQFNGTSWVPHVHLLSEDGDVAISSPTNLQVLQYNSGTGKWANATVSVSATLAGLTDVNITSVANGDMLVYDLASTKWKNIAAVAGQQAVTTTITSAGNRTTTSATMTMTGLGGTFSYTPTVTGKLLIFATVFGTAKVSAGGAANQLNCALAVGTGSAPAAGAAATGTVIGGQANVFLDTTANQEDAATLPIFASANLVVGTTYWFDFQIASGTAGAQSQIFTPSMTIMELGTPGFGGAGGGSSTLAADTDVALTSPANNDFLRYNSGTSKWNNVASPSIFYGDWNADAHLVGTFNAGFYGSIEILFPAGFTITHVCFMCPTAAATAHVTPAIYSVNTNGTLNTLVASGSTVVGAVAGFNSFPLTTPLVVGGSPVSLAIGVNCTVVALSVGTKTAMPAVFFSISVDTPVTTPPAQTFSTQGWAGIFAKGHYP